MSADWQLIKGPHPSRGEIEVALARQGLWLPIEHSLSWLKVHEREESWLLVLPSADSCAIAAVPVCVTHTRAFPGHLILRADRFGASIPAALIDRAAQRFRQLVADTPRVLHGDIEIFAADPLVYEAATAATTKARFQLSELARTYSRTIKVDLRRDQKTLVESFHRSLRKDLRALEAGPHRVAPITSMDFAHRIDALHQETMTRTGGRYARLPWHEHLRYALAHPDRSHINGLFLNGEITANNLAAVRWSVMQGDHAQDYFAASTRADGIPMMAGVVYQQLLWAKQAGAQWFDFGGIPNRDLPADDPLVRIADFKRKFSHQEIVVGGHWTWIVRPARNQIARSLHRLVHSIPWVARADYLSAKASLQLPPAVQDVQQIPRSNPVERDADTTRHAAKS